MIVTLLTDFGTADYFVGAMKGVILSRDPRLTIVDITHHVPPHDIDSAGFLLSAVYADFPPGTVHLAVVDPGVGSDRLPIAIQAGGFFFVGPDNGIFGGVLAREAHEARRIENDLLRRPATSSTFHGRDIFAPTAAALATGFAFVEVGRRVEPMAGVTALPPPSEDGLDGRILHIDRFGNCVTSFRPGGTGEGEEYEVSGDGWAVGETRSLYAGATPARPFLIVGSAGYLEISIDRGSAAAALGITRGDRIRIERRRVMLAKWRVP